MGDSKEDQGTGNEVSDRQGPVDLGSWEELGFSSEYQKPFEDFNYDLSNICGFGTETKLQGIGAVGKLFRLLGFIIPGLEGPFIKSFKWKF